MPRINLQDATAEAEERAGDLCVSCSAAAVDEWEPHCMHCGMYWKDVRDGMFDEELEDLTREATCGMWTGSDI